MTNIRELDAVVTIWLLVYAINTGKIGCECDNPKAMNVDGWLYSSPQTICDVKIKTSSESDQCQPSNGPYCFSLKKEGKLQDPNGGPLGGPKVECQSISCNNKNETLEEFAEHFDFLKYEQITQQNGEFYDSCGPAVLNNSIEFHHNSNISSQMNCTHAFQPSITLNTSGSTLMFLVDVTEPGTKFKNP